MNNPNLQNKLLIFCICYLASLSSILIFYLTPTRFQTFVNESFAHLLDGVGKTHDPLSRAYEGLRSKQHALTNGLVEAVGDLPGEFQMLRLVMTHRHMSGAMHEDIGSLKDRVGE